ncbi:hypothetical protein F5Y01DRAFT_313380 [Xylaria sp. FL0043]|nr:hypothetical protein F5Y01DRAFT_313380 [Xylaria sp. FL0043]
MEARRLEAEFTKTSVPLYHHHQHYQNPPPRMTAEEHRETRIDGHPPGLIHVSPSTVAPIRVLNNESVSQFRDIKPYLDPSIDENGYPVVVDLVCSICCASKLKARQCVMPQSHNESSSSDANDNNMDEIDAIEYLSVFPCGHFIGAECLKRWLCDTSNEEESSSPLRCSTCRFPCWHQCNHCIRPCNYDPRESVMAHIPRTHPEGGRVPDKCKSCFKYGYVQKIYEVHHLMLGAIADCPVGDLRYEESAEILEKNAERFLERMWEFWDLDAHLNHW